jgi:predicted nucleotidyltransferase
MKSIPLKYSFMVHRVDKVTTLTKFPGTLANYQDQMIDVFARAVPAKKFEVFLFGSRARGGEREGSDADLAISGKEIDRCDLSLISEQWEYSTIPMMLDLVDLKDINSALTRQIEKEKVLLWTSN